MIEITDLPLINTFFNLCSTICLIGGWIAIKKRKVGPHKKLMGTAFLFSTLFLVSYLFYHYHVGHKPFPGTGTLKIIYLSILIPHIILAAVMVPMILGTFYYALKGKFDSHKSLQDGLSLFGYMFR